MLKSLKDIQVFFDMKYKMFGQAVSKYTIVLICVLFDPLFQMVFYEDFNVLKGGKYLPRYLKCFLLQSRIM
jgi:hypothetical protein